MKALILSTLALLSSIAINAQSRCECRLLFEDMVRKVEENYIALALRREALQKDYEQHIKIFTEKAANATTTSCPGILQGFLRFFKDGHLFILEVPKPDEQELATERSRIKQAVYDTESVKKYLKEERNNLNSIEGLWTDGTSRFAIVKNTNPAWHHAYSAVIISSGTPDKIGELKFGVDLNDSRWEGTYVTNTYATRYVSLSPFKNNTILSISGGIAWARVEYHDEASIGVSPIINPALPSLKELDKETTLLTIPTFNIEAKEFYRVVEANQQLISRSKNLIIDIRGNTGGNAIFIDLMGLYSERPIVSEIGYALSSPDNISYFERFVSSSTKEIYEPVVKDMKENPGAIVKGPRFAPVRVQPIKSDIERVVILTDESNMSSAETFVLFSKQVSDKVTTIGSNTGGVVDYNNVNMIKLGCEKRGLMLGYPMYTLNERVVSDGYNKSGIKPDVVFDGRPGDLIAFAVKYVTKK